MTQRRPRTAQDGEAALAGGLAHHLDGDLQQGVRPVDELAEGVVGEDMLRAAGQTELVKVQAEQAAPPTPGGRLRWPRRP